MKRPYIDPVTSHRPSCFLLVCLALSMAAFADAQASFDWKAQGQNVFTVNCVSCHQTTGQGVPGSFPPLAGHVPEILEREGGRDLLPRVVLFGLEGRIEVDGDSYDGRMPSWGHLDDEEIAAVLNHIATSWGNADALPDDFDWYKPGEVADVRADELSARDVYLQRYDVGLAQPEPPEVSNEQSGETGATDQDNLDPSEIVYDEANGYYTDDQAERGAEAYAEHCAECHGSTLRGGLHYPALTNLAFFREWGGQPMTSLYSFVSSQMPVTGAGDLSESTYVRIMAFWLREHGYPSGSNPLIPDAEAMDQIVIENR